MSRRRARRSILAAWAASAVVHALIAIALLGLGGRRHPAPRPEEAIELETVEMEPAADVAPEAPSPPPASTRPRMAAVPTPRARAIKPAPSPANEAQAQAPPAPSSASGSAESVPAPGPETSPPPSAGAPKLDLSLGSLPTDIQERLAPVPPEGAIASRPPRSRGLLGTGLRDVDELRAEVERAEDAAANVASGRADPLLYDVLRGATQRFQSAAKRLADGLPMGAGASVGAWSRGTLARVAAANRGEIGARGDAPREGGGDTRNEISPHADMLGAYGEARRQAEGGGEERRAEICLEVAPGRESSVILRRGSGSGALDRLAVESFTNAAAARPVPADTRRGLACYEMRISANRVPPLPVFSCGFDRHGPTCIWPFKKVTSVEGRLVSVDYPLPAGARTSLLRRPH